MILLGMVACGGKKRNFKWEITQKTIKMSKAKRKENKKTTFCIMEKYFPL